MIILFNHSLNFYTLKHIKGYFKYMYTYMFILYYCIYYKIIYSLKDNN